MSGQPKPFEFSAGVLCLDFVNTLGDRPRCANEGLRGYEDLLRWVEEAGAVSSDILERVRRRARRRSGEARGILQRALGLRECLYRVFSAVARGEQPCDCDLAPLNAMLSEALPHLRLQGGETGTRWVWAGPLTRPDRLLWSVARSAADLLTSDEAGLVRECASDRCSWMFLDRSRSKRRRWCDMSTCGNRAKARRHYAKKKRAGGDGLA